MFVCFRLPVAEEFVEPQGCVFMIPVVWLCGAEIDTDLNIF